MPKYSLSKSERIKSRKVVEKLFSTGQSLFVHPLKLIYTPLLEEERELPPYLFGVTVPKRIHKTAVSRNRIKRLVREAYRLTKPQFLSSMEDHRGSYAIMFIYVHKQEATQVEVVLAMERLLKKLGKTISKKNDAQS